jgi:hypothetical protein
MGRFNSGAMMPKKKKNKKKKAKKPSKPRDKLKVRGKNPVPGGLVGRTREERMLYLGLAATEFPENFDTITYNLCAAPKQSEPGIDVAPEFAATNDDDKQREEWKKRKSLMEQWDKEHAEMVSDRDTTRKAEEPTYAKTGSVRGAKRHREPVRLAGSVDLGDIVRRAEEAVETANESMFDILLEESDAERDSLRILVEKAENALKNAKRLLEEKP